MLSRLDLLKLDTETFLNLDVLLCPNSFSWISSRISSKLQHRIELEPFSLAISMVLESW